MPVLEITADLPPGLETQTAMFADGRDPKVASYWILPTWACPGQLTIKLPARTLNGGEIRSNALFG